MDFDGAPNPEVDWQKYILYGICFLAAALVGAVVMCCCCRPKRDREGSEVRQSVASEEDLGKRGLIPKDEDKEEDEEEEARVTI